MVREFAPRDLPGSNPLAWEVLVGEVVAGVQKVLPLGGDVGLALSFYPNAMLHKVALRFPEVLDLERHRAKALSDTVHVPSDLAVRLGGDRLNDQVVYPETGGLIKLGRKQVVIDFFREHNALVHLIRRRDVTDAMNDALDSLDEDQAEAPPQGTKPA